MSAAENKRSTSAAGTKESRDAEEIREDIEQTREELGDTVAAVAEKTDVKQQAQVKVEELKGQAEEGVQQAQRFAKENPLAFAGVFLAGLVFGRLTSR